MRLMHRCTYDDCVSPADIAIACMSLRTLDVPALIEYACMPHAGAVLRSMADGCDEGEQQARAELS